MDSIRELLNHPHADLFLIGFGIVMSITGFIMIVRKGLALLFAVIIFVSGIIPLTYVFRGSDTDILNNAVARIGDAGSRLPGIRDDVLTSWCDKLDQAN